MVQAVLFDVDGVLVHDQLFDGLFFSCDIGVEKPKEGFFKAVAHRLGRSGKELLCIGTGG